MAKTAIYVAGMCIFYKGTYRKEMICRVKVRSKKKLIEYDVYSGNSKFTVIRKVYNFLTFDEASDINDISYVLSFSVYGVLP